MLFKKEILVRIQKGEIRLAFRKWTRPSVKEAGSLLTPAGQLRILSLNQIQYEDISNEDILNAGYTSRIELDMELKSKENGHIYRIEFELESEDPRIALREITAIPNEELKTILQKLARLDNSDNVKGWTMKVLQLLENEPGKFAREYAAQLGVEKEWLKLNIRKLKNLGLTVSLVNGYQISPRGKVVLKHLMQNKHGNHV